MNCQLKLQKFVLPVGPGMVGSCGKQISPIAIHVSCTMQYLISHDISSPITFVGRVSEVMDILAHRGTKFQFNDSKNKTTYTEKDIITSVKKLSKLGSGFSTIKVGRVVLIVSIPEELDKDHMEVLKLAEKEPDGMVRTEVVSKELEWDIERSNRALELLLSKGMVWLDVHCGGNKYWFPR